MSIDQNVVYQKLLDAGTEWADAEAGASLMEETKRSVLAKLMNGCDERSIAAKESWALEQQEYLDHVKGMIESRRIANRAKVKYNSMRVWADMFRTVEATKRVELQNLKG